TTKTTAADSKESGESTTESTTETTERSNESSTEETTTTTEATTVTTASSAGAVVTTATAPVTTRPRAFVDVAEEIPLGVKTTAPIDLEIVITEAVPLSGLPYTASVPFELFIGFGILILTIGLTVGRRL
ncbi:MAG: hypothetical protein Q4A41_04570, partial [Bacillota bacterium]|nr:hypothetical protein [Bacillota bacterium]